MSNQPSRRIKIVRIIGRLNIGGPALHVLNLGVRLDATRFEQTLVVGRERAQEGSLLAEVRSRGLEVVVIPEMVTELSLRPRDLVALIKLRRLIRAAAPDVVHTHTAKAGFLGRVAAWLAGVPVIVHTYHGHVLHGYFGRVVTALIRALERALASITDRLVAVSPQVKTELTQFGVGPARKIAVIPLGLELEPFLSNHAHRGELRRELAIGPGTPLIGMVGRIVPIKNHALFLKAAARLAMRFPNARFLIVGDGELRSEIERLAAELLPGQRVTFLGWRSDMPRIYADLNALVVCSDNEGTPVAAIEAMAAGCPVVGTRVGGVPDLITHERTGLLVPPRDPEALMAALSRILTEPELVGRLRNEARTLARQGFHAGRLARDMAGLYEELVASAGRA